MSQTRSWQIRRSHLIVTLLVRAGLGLTLGLMAPLALSVTQYTKNNIPFTRSLSQLKSSLNLPVVEKVAKLEIPMHKLKIRALKWEKDDRIDPVQVYVPRDPVGLEKLATKLAKPGRKEEIEQILLEKLKAEGPTSRTRLRVDLTLDDLKKMRLKAITEAMAHLNYDVAILAKKLMKNTQLRNEFLSQIKPFFELNQRRNIANRLRAGKNLDLAEDLLPGFARRMAKKFTVYRGPNCFHAALAFHDQDLTKSPRINVKEEPGYHRAMINYDELWRVINRNFYEVDPRKYPLKYGDMIVFFSAPRDGTGPINFRWIRHTATYLFGPYTFSKGSKSPNTPYSIKTLPVEWKTWHNYSKNLGIKVFRRNSFDLTKTPPFDLTDWIY
jgi:hypothetical protein